MKFKCLLDWHSFEPISVSHYWDISYGGQAPSTCITSKCTRCHKITTQGLYNSGFLTLEQLKGELVVKC
jgi:hypothetical protein